MTDDDHVIECRGLTRAFGGQEAVSDLDLAVPPGSIFGFLGPSGSGKTTTVRLLIGLLRPSAGEIFVLGRPPVRFTRADRRRLGYLAQRPPLFPQLSLAANLRYSAGLYGVRNPRRRIAELIELMELSGHERKPVRQTSGGMQRRTALAAALLHDPELVFLDEPTAALDPVLRAKLWEHFQQLRQEGRTLFVTTHYVSEARWCDQLAVLVQGRLLAVGSPAELRRRASGGDLVEVRAESEPAAEDVSRLRALDGVASVTIAAADARTLTVVVDDGGRRISEIVAALAPLPVESIEVQLPSFDEVFATLVKQAGAPEGDEEAA